MSKSGQVKSSAFAMITNVSDMIRYLDSSKRRLQHTEYLYHYTTLDNAIKIIRSEKWHLVNAKYMNDMKEYSDGSKELWNNLFFSSFMREDKESIGMWSMYAQPWSEGVKISIPTDTFKKWIEEQVDIIYEVSTNGYRPVWHTAPIVSFDKSRVYISTIAYSNFESSENSEEPPKLVCGTKENKKIKKEDIRKPELTGYIKDMAWSYEKEVRIKAEIDNTQGYDRLAIDVPNKVIEAMTITASPLFEGDLEEKLNEKLSKERMEKISVDESLFKGKLHIKNSCQDCKYKIKHKLTKI